MSSQHLSVRLSPETLSRLDSESHRTGQTRSQVAKTLLEEGLRMEHHPGITFRSGPAGRRAALFNGPDVWEVIRTIGQLSEIGDALVQRTAVVASIQEDAVRVALRYYAEFEHEIDRWIAQVEEEEAAAEARYERERQLLQR